MSQLENSVGYALLARILEVVRESGANEIEALCAVRGAEAMLPELNLRKKPSMVIGNG